MNRFILLLCLWATSASASDLGHSHNDYEHVRPLEDALALGYTSVEADVWLRSGEMRIGHMPWEDKGSLEELYLDPLQRLVDRQGSVHGDGRPFLLWIDIKSMRTEFPDALKRVLEAYSMLTIFSDGDVEQRPVTVVLTGNNRNKAAMVDGHPFRRACRDQDAYSMNDPIADHRWLWYGVNWSKVSNWNGQGEMPSVDRTRFRHTVRAMHATGRRVRFWATPETREFWREAVAAGVDLINTNEIEDLARFLEEETL